MKTMTFEFLSNGTKIRKRAVISDTLDKLSESKRNEAYDTDCELWADGFWSVFFEGDPGIQYEIELKFDKENRQKTLEPIKAITWENDVITDVQTVTVKVK